MKFYAILVLQLVVYSVNADLLDKLAHSHDHGAHHDHHHDDHHGDHDHHAHHDEHDGDHASANDVFAEYDDIPTGFFQFLPKENNVLDVTAHQPLTVARLQKELDALNFLEGIENPHFDDSPENVAILNANVPQFDAENVPEEFDQLRSLTVPSQPLRLPEAPVGHFFEFKVADQIPTFTFDNSVPQTVPAISGKRLPTLAINNNNVASVAVDSGIPEAVVHDSLPEVVIHDNIPEVVIHDNIPEVVIHDNIPEVAVHSRIPEVAVHSRIPEVAVHSRIPETTFHSRIPETTFDNIIPETTFDNIIPETTFDNIIPAQLPIPRSDDVHEAVEALLEAKADVVEELLDDHLDALDAPAQSSFADVSNFIGGQGRQLDRGIDSDEDDRSLEDFPTFREVPETSFRCEDQDHGGYYADTETDCQVFHICLAGHSMGSFLCPEQTVFNQEYFVCDWWHKVECNAAPDYFFLNARIGVVPDDSNSIEE